ncbi:MAG: amino acid racemase [Bacteroidales bacterium]|nr:amino acid racemase [Bacteroidales bacterium]
MGIKKIGIIGGIGPESTIDYYKLIIKKIKKAVQSSDYPQIIINSINMTQLLNFINQKQFIELVSFLRIEVNKLEMAGADFCVLAANTPHIIFDELKENINMPIISIVEETCKKIKIKELDKVGLIGTKFTMEAGFYNKVAEKYNIQIITPDKKQQNYIHNKYMNELVFGIINDVTKVELIGIINNLQKAYNIQGLILGGTELPLILKQDDFNDIIILNTTEIHVDSIVRFALS